MGKSDPKTNLIENKKETDLPVPPAFIAAMSDKHSNILVPVKGPEFIIGRDPGGDLCLIGDKSVSWKHCLIHAKSGNLVLEDLGSKNGTFLNGRRIVGTATLFPPCFLMLGRTQLGLVRSTAEYNRTAILEAAYSTKESVLVPSTEIFQVRSEAFYVVDVMGSSKLLQKAEVTLAKIVAAIGQLLEKYLRTEQQSFLKCTGDGFFACFSEPTQALQAAICLGPELRRYFSIPLRLSTALHYGSARMTTDGDRTGINVHAVFALEDLRRRQKLITDLLADSGKEDLILLTRSFYDELPEYGRRQAIPVGSFSLKGLLKEEPVFLWPS